MEVSGGASVRVQEVSGEELVQGRIDLHHQLHTSSVLPHLPCRSIFVAEDQHRQVGPQDLRLADAHQVEELQLQFCDLRVASYS
jgi:hypothetical protein